MLVQIQLLPIICWHVLILIPFLVIYYDRQVLHAARVFGSLGRVGDGCGVWVAGISEGAPYAVVVGLPSLEPAGASDALAHSVLKGDEELARRLAAAFEQGDDIEFDDETGAVVVGSSSGSQQGGGGSLEEKRRALTALLSEARRVCRSSVAPELHSSSSSSSSDADGNSRGLSLPRYDEASDMYQWAALAYWAFTQREWVAGASQMPSMPPSMPRAGELSDLLGEVLSRGRDRRPTPREALHHPFFTLARQGSDGAIIVGDDELGSSVGGGDGVGGGGSGAGRSGGMGAAGGYGSRGGHRGRGGRGGRGGGRDEDENDEDGDGGGDDDEGGDESDDKVEALRQICGLLRENNADKGRWHVTVTRAAIVDTVVLAFGRASPERLLRRLTVRFQDEPGIDAGGLTKEMYSCFFEALTSADCSLFECDKDAESPTYLPSKEEEDGGGEGEEGIAEEEDEESSGYGRSRGRRRGSSSRGSRNDSMLETYEAVGRVLGKAILDGVPIVTPFHAVVFRSLLRPRASSRFGRPNLHELEAFSPREAMSCRQLLAMPDVSGLYLTFDPSGGGGGGSGEGGGSGGGAEEEGVAVTNANVKEYVRWRAEQELLGRRRRRLEALRKGFAAVPLGPHLRRFSAFELTSLVCGKQAVGVSA